MIPVRIVTTRGETTLAEQPNPLELDRILPGAGPLEVEIGFGKGRYLRSRASAEPTRRFLGIEIVSKYHRLLVHAMRRRGLANLALLRGEALYLACAVLPRGFASVVHVYFPDPWPKSRHHRRRLFDPRTVDLVLGLLEPGGQLAFATDHLEYGESVEELLIGHPALAVERLAAWPEGPRTHYESKYVREGRQIVRLTATAVAGAEVHPAAGDGLRLAWRPISAAV